MISLISSNLLCKWLDFPRLILRLKTSNKEIIYVLTCHACPHIYINDFIIPYQDSYHPSSIIHTYSFPKFYLLTFNHTMFFLNREVYTDFTHNTTLTPARACVRDRVALTEQLIILFRSIIHMYW